MPKKNDTVRYSVKQIKSKIARGEDRTDWRKANSLTGKKLDASIRRDVDDVHVERAVFDLHKIFPRDQCLLSVFINVEAKLAQGRNTLAGVLRVLRRKEIEIKGGPWIAKENRP